MVLVIGATSIILGLCAGTIHALLGVHRSSREHLAEATTVGRLALQFRRDARAATGAKAIGDGGPGGDGAGADPPRGRDDRLPGGRRRPDPHRESRRQGRAPRSVLPASPRSASASRSRTTGGRPWRSWSSRGRRAGPGSANTSANCESRGTSAATIGSGRAGGRDHEGCPPRSGIAPARWWSSCWSASWPWP